MRKYVLMTVMALSMTVYANQDGGARLIDYVNPFVGTDGYGNVYPGAQIPFGGIQISPDTDEHFYDCASGYKWNRQSIQGFSLISAEQAFRTSATFFLCPVRAR